MAASSSDAEEDDRHVARVLAEVVADADRRRSTRGVATRPASFSLPELRTRLRRDRVYADPTRLLRRLRRRGLLEEMGDAPAERSYAVPEPEMLRELLLGEAARDLPPEGAYGPVPDEAAELRSLDADFLAHLRHILDERLEETIEFGRSFSVARLEEYLTALFSRNLSFDPLLSLLQQYALADVPLLAPTGRATGSTGFHLALFGPPGTGKTFAIDDLIRGNPHTGVPPHGLPGRNRYCGGITPVQFLRVGAFYTGRTFNFIVPEFNDWFKFRGMVEPLKLVMEQREVKWETTFGTVGPYTFRSFFSVNYNVRTAGTNDYWATVSDPNFAALEDRMLLRFHVMTRDRFRAVEASSERLELGDLEFDQAVAIRDHLTLVHAIESHHPLVAHRFRSKGIRLPKMLYDRLRGVTEKALSRTTRPTFSPRLRIRAVRVAAAAALLRYFAHDEQESLPIEEEEIRLAEQFYAEEIQAREGRRGSAS